MLSLHAKDGSAFGLHAAVRIWGREMHALSHMPSRGGDSFFLLAIEPKSRPHCDWINLGSFLMPMLVFLPVTVLGMCSSVKYGILVLTLRAWSEGRGWDSILPECAGEGSQPCS